MIDFFLRPEGDIHISMPDALSQQIDVLHNSFGSIIDGLRQRDVLKFKPDNLKSLQIEPLSSVLYHISNKNIVVNNTAIYVEAIQRIAEAAEFRPFTVRQDKIYLPIVSGSTSLMPVELSPSAIEDLYRMHDDLKQILGAEWANFTSIVRVLTVVGVPGYDDLPYFSGSSSEVWGAIHTCWPSDPAILAETLTHEAAHHWVHIVEDLGPLAHECWEGDVWPSPWRDELRPLGGVIHGVPVFAAAAVVLCRLMLQCQSLDDEKAQVLSKRIAYLVVQVELGVLICQKSGCMLPNGNRLLHTALEGLSSIQSQIPRSTLEDAKKLLEHRMEKKFMSWRQKGLHWNAS